MLPHRSVASLRRCFRGLAALSFVLLPSPALLFLLPQTTCLCGMEGLPCGLDVRGAIPASGRKTPSKVMQGQQTRVEEPSALAVAPTACAASSHLFIVRAQRTALAAAPARCVAAVTRKPQESQASQRSPRPPRGLTEHGGPRPPQEGARELQKDTNAGVTVTPKGDQLTELEGTITGPDDTPYAGGFYAFRSRYRPATPSNPQNEVSDESVAP